MAGGMQIASLFASIGADTSGLQKGLGGAKTSLEGLGSSMAKQVLGTVSLVAAIAGAGKLVASSVSDWANYADSMRLSAQMAGVTTEEMSRLAQAADDFRVPIETMQKSMEMALKNGFVPSIANIAALSDQLIAIEDPAERAAAASKIFGKSYADMMPFLLAGGDAIKSATDSISENLIVTAKAAAEAKEYKDSLDELGDTWTGLKNIIGKALAPVASNLFTSLTDDIGEFVGQMQFLALATEALTQKKIDLKYWATSMDFFYTGDMTSPEYWKAIGDGIDYFNVALGNTSTVATSASGAMDVGTESLTKQQQALAVYQNNLSSTTAALDAQAAVAKDAEVAWDSYVSAVGNVTSLTSSFTSIIGLAKNYDDILFDIAYNAEERDRLMAAGFSETSDEVKALDDSTLALQGTMTDLANQMTLDMLQATIAIGGITSAEASAYFQMAEDMGIISQDAANAATLAYTNAVDTINGMTIDDKEGNVTANIAAAMAAFDYLEQYALLDKEQRVFVTTYYGTDTYDYDLNDRPGGATGGQITHGGLITVGERGPELVYLPDNAQIIPYSRTDETIKGLAGNGGNVYNLTMYTSSNPADVRTAFELMEVWA